LVDQPARAESLARDALAVREKQSPDDWLTYATRSLLVTSLLSQKKYAEAEPLLLHGYEGLKARELKIPAYARNTVTEAGEWIVKLYDGWGKKEKAVEWGKRLAASSTIAKPIK
jgi:eukaryotic-like serine/threonine-protein kinase